MSFKIKNHLNLNIILESGARKKKKERERKRERTNKQGGFRSVFREASWELYKYSFHIAPTTLYTKDDPNNHSDSLEIWNALKSRPVELSSPKRCCETGNEPLQLWKCQGPSVGTPCLRTKRTKLMTWYIPNKQEGVTGPRHRHWRQGPIPRYIASAPSMKMQFIMRLKPPAPFLRSREATAEKSGAEELFCMSS